MKESSQISSLYTGYVLRLLTQMIEIRARMRWYNAKFSFGWTGFQMSMLHVVIKGTLEIMEVKLRKLGIINHIFVYFGLPHNFMNSVLHTIVI